MRKLGLQIALIVFTWLSVLCIWKYNKTRWVSSEDAGINRNWYYGVRTCTMVYFVDCLILPFMAYFISQESTGSRYQPTLQVSLPTPMMAIRRQQWWQRWWWQTTKTAKTLMMTTNSNHGNNGNHGGDKCTMTERGRLLLWWGYIFLHLLILLAALSSARLDTAPAARLSQNSN